MDINIAFSRQLLKEAHAAVKQHDPTVKLRSAWVYKTGRQSWEFHGPNDFYWYGHASNAYEARATGWFAYLAKRETTDEGGKS